MSRYIKPTLLFTSNSEAAAADPGPMSFALNLNTVPTADVVSGVTKGRLTVDEVECELIETSTTQTQLIDGADDGGATKTVGTVGCYIYLKNHSTTTGEHILFAIRSGARINDAGTIWSGTDSPTAPGAGSSSGDSSLHLTTNATARTFTLMPGEFAFFPFDFTGDIYYEAATGTPALEYWRFDK